MWNANKIVEMGTYRTFMKFFEKDDTEDNVSVTPLDNGESFDKMHEFLSNKYGEKDTVENWFSFDVRVTRTKECGTKGCKYEGTIENSKTEQYDYITLKFYDEKKTIP